MQTRSHYSIDKINIHCTCQSAKRVSQKENKHHLNEDLVKTTKPSFYSGFNASMTSVAVLSGTQERLGKEKVLLAKCQPLVDELITSSVILYLSRKTLATSYFREKKSHNTLLYTIIQQGHVLPHVRFA